MSDSPGQLAIVETHTLKFGFPESFITTLQRLLNHKLREGNIGIHTQLSIIDSNGKNLSSEYNWPSGCNTLYVINTKDQKKLAKLIVFNLNKKVWFRYILPHKQNLKKKNETQILTFYLNTILNEVVIDEKRNINVIHLVNNPKPLKTKLSSIIVDLNFIQYPLYLAYFIAMLIDITNWYQYMVYIPFYITGKYIIKLKMEIDSRWP